MPASGIEIVPSGSTSDERFKRRVLEHIDLKSVPGLNTIGLRHRHRSDEQCHQHQKNRFHFAYTLQQVIPHTDGDDTPPIRRNKARKHINRAMWPFRTDFP